MRKVMWTIVVIAVVSFIILSNNPIDETVNFIIGGEIPHTNMVLGFWPSIGFVGIVLWLIRRGLSNLHLEMISHTAKEITAETEKREFKESHASDETQKNRSVIAAPTGISSSF